MKNHRLSSLCLVLTVLVLVTFRVTADVWVTPMTGGEIRFDDWGYTGPGGRTAVNFDPMNGGFGGPLQGNDLDPNGGVGQIQVVITSNPDFLTPDDPTNAIGDLTGTPIFTNANPDAVVNFYDWAYTTEAGSTFSNMSIDYDGDYLVKAQDMSFVLHDTFFYRDTTGTNPDLDFDTNINFKPWAISDATGWCGSVLASHPLALEPMAGQVMFDIVFETFLPTSPTDPSWQVVPGFIMRSYGTVEVIGGAGDQYYKASAVVNNTSPLGTRDAANPLGYSDINYYNTVSFMGAGQVPGGIWIEPGALTAKDVRIHPVQGANGSAPGEVRGDGAVWHENSFAGYPFLLRADADRNVTYFDEAVYGPDPVGSGGPAPLPEGSTLSIDQGVGSTSNTPCPTGSCFGMEVAPDFVVWTDIGPGTDGGIVVGKEQASGGQENYPAPDTAGELSAAWLFFNNWGSFGSLPGGVQNVFSDQSCTREGCMGVTELKAFYAHWNGSTAPLGSADGCNSGNCTVDHLANIYTTSYNINLDANGLGDYELNWSNVVPDGDDSGFGGVVFSLILRGNVVKGVITSNLAPNAGDVLVNDVYSGDIAGWTPVVSDANGDTLSCTMVTAPTSGQATVSSDCMTGEYVAADGFVGTDTFTYQANDGALDSAPATVTVNVIERPIVSACDNYPIRQVVTPGGGQSNAENAEITMIFTGKIITETGLTSGAKNSVKICPGTTVGYEAIATIGTPICILNNTASTSTGTAAIGDKLVCTNKPDGRDTDRFNIKNGF